MIDHLCRHIIERLHVNRVVETGTHAGETVAEVRRWNLGVDIYSVDIDKGSYLAAKERFKGLPQVHLAYASSEVFLATLLRQELDSRQRINTYLFFLDAHWGRYWPLRDEIQVIQNLNTYVVVIDDFFVPGKSDPESPSGHFGFDIYEGRVLDWSYVRDLFQQTRVRVFYPGRTGRDRRGWVLIAKGHSDDEVAFLAQLELFEMDQNDVSHTMPVGITWRAYWDIRRTVKAVIPAWIFRRILRIYRQRFTLQ